MARLSVQVLPLSCQLHSEAWLDWACPPKRVKFGRVDDLWKDVCSARFVYCWVYVHRFAVHGIWSTSVLAMLCPHGLWVFVIYVWSGKVRLTLEVLTHHQLPTGSPLPKWIVLELRSMPNAQLDRPAQLDRTDNPYRSDRSLKGEIVVWGTSKPPKRLEKHFQGKTLSVLVPLLPPIFSWV